MEGKRRKKKILLKEREKNRRGSWKEATGRAQMGKFGNIRQGSIEMGTDWVMVSHIIMIL